MAVTEPPYPPRPHRILPVLGLAVGFVGLSLLAAPQPASAHVLKQDNGVDALLHIPPDDHPKAGQPTRLEILYGSTSGHFSLADCSCQIILQDDNGVQIQQTSPAATPAGDHLNSAASVTFPQIGVYNLIITGSAKDNAFGPFSMTYPVRVATAVPRQTRNGLGLLIIAGSVAVVAAFSAASILLRQKRSK